MAKLPLLLAVILLPTTANALTYQALDLGNLNANTPVQIINFLDNTGRASGYFFPATSGQAYLYDGSYHNLGTLGGIASSTYVNAMNANFVVGSSLNAAAAQHAFLYDGTMHDLGTFGGYSLAAGVNDSGIVVGSSYSTAAGSSHAFLYDSSLHDITPAAASSSATGISNDGRVAGYFTPSGSSSTHAFLYQNGSLQDLNPLIPSASSSNADGITSNGSLFGRFNGPSFDTPFVYDGTMHLDNAGNGILISSSSNGLIVGQDANGALLYHNGTFTSLGFGAGSQALAVNAAGQIVGSANGHAFFYDGIFHDLNSLVSLPSGWTLTSADAINDQSQILAGGFNSSLGKSDVFLITAPEPTTLSLTFAASLLLATRRRNPRT